MSDSGGRALTGRIGVFGGSFDPVHLGHLIAAEQARVRLKLDHVRFIPTGRQPLKVDGHAAAAAHRLAMLEAAIGDHPGFVLDRREIEREGPSYTVDTLQELRAEFPQDRLFLLIGADAARDLSVWHQAQRLPQLATVVVVTRPGVEPPRHPAIGQVLEIPGIEVSATQIRSAVGRGESIRYLVPRVVEDYIAAQQLYRTGA